MTGSVGGTNVNRTVFILSLFDHSGLGLEISPSFNPLLPKTAGYTVETVDYATAAELKQKYNSDPRVDVSKIEAVDYVCDGADIAGAIGQAGRFDFVLASHVIEHIPDMLSFLKGCETVMKPSGRLVLVIPDKRFCFDALQTLSSTGDVLQAYLEKRSRHCPGNLFDFIAYRSVRTGRITWEPGDSTDLQFEFSLEQARDIFEAGQQSDVYHDIHTWRFTPSSFRLIMRDLAAIGMIGLREEAFHATVGCEFFAILSRDGQGCPESRLALAKTVIDEQKAILVASGGLEKDGASG
jgi:SAM-dependent methyltransferase